MGVYKYRYITHLKPGDAVVKYDNRYHPKGSKLNEKKRGIVIEQSEKRTVISWLEGSIENIYQDRDRTQVMVEASWSA